MWHAGLNEAQAGIKTAEKNIKNLRYTDATTLMAKSEKKLKSLLMKVKGESEKADLKLNIQKWRSWHLVPSLHSNWENNGKVTDFIFLDSRITIEGDCSHEIERY